MKTVLQCFKKNYREKYESVGFLMSKSTFLRVRGDMVQSFSFKPSQMKEPICSVEFGVFPLCLPQPVFFEAGGYMLDWFLVDQAESFRGWRYDAQSDYSIRSCIKSVSDTIDLYLLPFFDSICDCEEALRELYHLEELFDNNRKRVVYLQGGADFAKPWQERSLFDSRKYYMALKVANWDYAKTYLIQKVKYYQSESKRFDSQKSPRQPDIVIKKHSLELASCKEQLNMIQTCNYGFFTEQLSANETEMHEFLRVKYPKLSRTG